MADGPRGLAGSATGVFIGAHSHSNDYRLLQLAQAAGIEAHASTGSAHSILANRISYLLDLRGPSVCVDTACSSSLVAVHLACQSLRTGESDLALAGGVNLMLLPPASLEFAKLQILSPNGRCRTFDAAADGIARGEGCGLVVLKRLADARRDGDPVLAVIRGSAVNQDGASNGLTAPNGPAQEAVVRRALKIAGIGPERLGLVETHGTGTALGDPVEVEALARVIGAPRSATHRCWLGAVKTNIGHLEGAAGIAGLIKAVLCLQHRRIPKNLHFTALNPHISLAGTPLAIPTGTVEWAGGGQPRVAAVSSFGFGGTNAHVVVEEAPPAAPAPGADTAAAPAANAAITADPATAAPAIARVLPLSARHPAALQALARDHAARLEAIGDGGPAALAAPAALADHLHTAAARRMHHPWRLAVTGGNAAELAAALRRRVDEASDARGPGSAAAAGVVFVFTGQGGLWPGMARSLHESEPVFRATLEDVGARFERVAGWNPLPDLVDPARENRLAATEVAQPALFALQVALTALWRALGLAPAAAVGHSVGEVAAAHAARVLTLDDAVALVWHRSRLMQPAAGAGRMAQVDLPAAEASAALRAFGERLSMAAHNGPAATVIAGEPAALQQCLAQLEARGVATRRLPVDYAFHSAQMAPFCAPLVAALAGLAPRAGTLPIVSTVTGTWPATGDFGAAYWARNVREPVRFLEAAETLIDAGYGAFLEVGPHPALGAGLLAAGATRGLDLEVQASLRRERGTRADLVASLAALYEAGATIDWRAHSSPGARVVDGPTYPWQRQRHWLAAPDAAALAYHVMGRTAAMAAPGVPTAAFTLQWEAAAAEGTPAIASGTAGGPRGRWLVLADRQGVGAALAARLRAGGATVREVTAADVGREGLPADLASAPWQGVVHCGALDVAPEGSLAECDRLLDSGLHGLLAAAQPLARRAAQAGGVGQAPQLWIATRGAQRAHPNDRAVSAGQAVLWAFGRTLALEAPGLWGGLVDLGVDDTVERCAQSLAEELASPGEDQVARRGTLRLRLRLVARESTTAPAASTASTGPMTSHTVEAAPAAAADPSAPPPAHGAADLAGLAQGSVVVTGGLGSLGGTIARWLAGRGARHIVVVGRSPTPPRKSWGRLPPAHAQGPALEAFAALEAAGVQVQIVRADVADAVAMRTLFEDLRRAGRPVRGVVHAAMVFEPVGLESLTPAALRQAMRAKVNGAWLLHELTRDTPTDLFVLFSSVAAVFGAKGIATYAAGNEFLAGLAEHRRLAGLPATCVDWGTWAEPRAGARDRRGDVDSLGLADLDPEWALAQLDRLIADGTARCTIAAIDTGRARLAYESQGARPFLERFGSASGSDEATAAGDAQAMGARRAAEWQALPRHECAAEVQAIVRAELARVLGIAAPDAVPGDAGFNTLGLDSLMAVRLRRRLGAHTGLELANTLTFNHPNIDALTAYLVDRLLGPAALPANAPAPAASAPAPVEPVDDEQVHDLLRAELEALRGTEVLR
jgi:acyl transferase domain-containing protein